VDAVGRDSWLMDQGKDAACPDGERMIILKAVSCDSLLPRDPVSAKRSTSKIVLDRQEIASATCTDPYAAVRAVRPDHVRKPNGLRKSLLQVQNSPAKAFTWGSNHLGC
jgi:hypothetical protein